MNELTVEDSQLIERVKKSIKWETKIVGDGDKATITTTGRWGRREDQKFTSIYRMELRHILKLSQEDHIRYRQAEIIRRILMKMAVQEAQKTHGNWEDIVRRHIESEDKLRFEF